MDSVGERIRREGSCQSIRGTFTKWEEESDPVTRGRGAAAAGSGPRQRSPGRTGAVNPCSITDVKEARRNIGDHWQSSKKEL